MNVTVVKVCWIKMNEGKTVDVMVVMACLN